MPPKPKAGAAAQPSKKTEAKKKDKIIEDKTFGLKNKKGAKNQKFIQQVQTQVKFGQQSARKLEEQKKLADSKKKDDKKAEQEISSLFKPVNQKVEKGADPKSVLCAFFKQGQCMKGDRCKFSHDLMIERKSEKRSAYVDLRDDENMENWDEEKLKEVIDLKHGEDEKLKPKTDIICRYFLDALERNKYGWFWECPSGEKCIYRHALPSGFVLNRDKKKEEKKDELSIEDLVEKERANLGHVVTKVTLESFIAWKKRKQKEKEDTTRKEEARKKAEFKSGKNIGLSGREMFTFRPEMATEDLLDDDEVTMDTTNLSHYENDADGEERDYVNGEVSNDVNAKELTLESLAFELQEVDFSGTISVRQHATASNDTNLTNHIEESNKLAEAVGGGDIDEAIASTSYAPSPEEVPIDEDLFAEDDEDMDELEENLDSMDVMA